MSKSRTQTWIALILVPVGLLLVGIPGLWVYMSATKKPLHPNAKDVPSVTHSETGLSSVEADRYWIRAA